MNATLLQIFLLVNVFLIGALVAIAIRHAYAHFRPDRHDAEKTHAKTPGVHLSSAAKERLLLAAEANFQKVLDRSAAELERDQQNIIAQLNKQFEKIGSQVVLHEMARYQEALEKLRKDTENTLGGAQEEVAKHQADLAAKFTARQAILESQLTEDMAAEKKRMIEQMDTKLADAVASFLVETLPHNVDLGAQSTYLMAMLEEHKAELVKGVSNDT